VQVNALVHIEQLVPQAEQVLFATKNMGLQAVHIVEFVHYQQLAPQAAQALLFT
jgi:hypothetical protein